ncbi:MAG: hypothetical protein IPI89_14265 [Propionivibrio sp.]|nr:hypothetical protein [Propionivibrio sp.]
MFGNSTSTSPAWYVGPGAGAACPIIRGGYLSSLATTAAPATMTWSQGVYLGDSLGWRAEHAPDHRRLERLTEWAAVAQARPWSSSGTFIQGGGTVTASGGVGLGYGLGSVGGTGSYTINGGTLNAAFIDLGNTTTERQLRQQRRVGEGGSVPIQAT